MRWLFALVACAQPVALSNVGVPPHWHEQSLRSGASGVDATALVPAGVRIDYIDMMTVLTTPGWELDIYAMDSETTIDRELASWRKLLDTVPVLRVHYPDGWFAAAQQPEDRWFVVAGTRAHRYCAGKADAIEGVHEAQRVIESLH
jgi:hypothetical protein